MEQIKHLLDVHFLIHAFGYPGLFAIIFAETGLMLGFFLPGDSLLVAAGISAARGDLDIGILLPLLMLSAILGNTVGYFFGKHVGGKIFTKKDSLLFKKEHIHTAHAFYEKHGGKAIIIARFVPVIRTFAPIVAGMADMNFKTFFIYNIIGSGIWAGGITILGFFLGRLVTDKYFEPLILTVIVVSLLPALYEGLKTKEQRARLLSIIKRQFQKK